MPVEEIADIDLGTDEKTFDELDRAAARAIKVLEKRNKELEKTKQALESAQRVREEAGGAFPQAELPETSGPAQDISNLFKQDKKLEKKLERQEQKTKQALESAQKIREEAGGAFPQAKLPETFGPAKDISKLSKQDQMIEKELRKLEEKVRKDEVKQLGNKETIFDKVLGNVAGGNLISMGKNPTGFVFGIMKVLPILGGVLAAKDIALFIIDEIAKIDKFFKAFIDVVDNRIDAFRSLQQQANVQAGLTQRIITTSSGSTEPRYSYNTFEQFNSNRADLEVRFQMTNDSGVE